MKTIVALLLMGIWWLVSGSQAPAAAPRPPNILFIFIDDLGWRDCGFSGSDFYETPHLDALAERGMVFTDAYAAAANCAPSRACLLSGQYTPRHQIFNVGTRRRGDQRFGKLRHVPGTATLRQDIVSWAGIVGAAGYHVGVIGKWHLGEDPRTFGFDFTFACSPGGSPPRGYFPPHPETPDLNDAPPGQYLTDRLTDEAIAFVDRNRDRPWLLYLSHFAVHTPLEAPSALVAKYRRQPAGSLHSDPLMAAMIESVDTGIGRMVAHLQRRGIEDHTVIVFTSDNGGYGPATSMDPLKGYKGTYYEGGIRVPLLVVWPGVVAPGSTCSVPVINIDWFPTFCELADAPLPDHQPLDGVSLVPLLKQSGSLAERAIFWHFPAYLQSYRRIDSQRDPLYRSRPCSVIRQGRWKLHEYFEDGAVELYDLSQDLGETTNLAAREPEQTRRLHRQLIAWRQATGAPVPSEPNPHYDADAEAAAIRAAVATDH